MWSLGKVLGTPEVLRVYLGSFWDNKLQARAWFIASRSNC